MTKEVHLWFVPTPHIRGDAQANVPRSWAPANRSNMLFQWWVSLPPCITLIPIAHKLCLCYCFLPSQTYTQETFRPDLFYHPLGKHCRSFEIGISAPESNCLPSWKMSIFYTLTSAFMEMKSASHSVTFFNFTAYNCLLPVCERYGPMGHYPDFPWSIIERSLDSSMIGISCYHYLQIINHLSWYLKLSWARISAKILRTRNMHCRYYLICEYPIQYFFTKRNTNLKHFPIIYQVIFLCCRDTCVYCMHGFSFLHMPLSLHMTLLIHASIKAIA